MPSAPEPFHAFVIELFEPVAPITIRKMFGGAGLFRPGPDGPLMFGLIAFDTIYLKVDDTNRPAFEAAGSKPFVYEGKTGGSMTMSHWQLPDEALDDPDALQHWAALAWAAALRAHAKKPKRKPKGKAAAKRAR